MTEKTMTKTEFMAALAEGAGIEKAAAQRVVASLAEIIHTTVAAGGAVTIPGLGKFSLRERQERLVRNPATGEAFTKPADRVVKVTIAKQLKDAISA